MKDVSPFKEVLLACDSQIRKLKKDSGTSNAIFDELAERSLMSPSAGKKHTYVRLAK